MASFASSDHFSHAYPCEHSRWVRTSSYWIQDDRTAPFSSPSGSSNHFDTPEESTSFKTPSGSGEDEFNNHKDSDHSINSQDRSEGFPFTHETINPAVLTLGHPSSGSQDNLFTQSSSTFSGMRSTLGIAQPKRDSRVEEQGIGSPFRDADRRFSDRRCKSNPAESLPDRTKWQNSALRNMFEQHCLRTGWQPPARLFPQPMSHSEIIVRRSSVNLD